VERRHPGARARRADGDVRPHRRSRQGVVCQVVCGAVPRFRGDARIRRQRPPDGRHHAGSGGARGLLRFSLMSSPRRLQLALFVLGAAIFGYLVARIGIGQLVSDAGRTGFMFVPIVLLYALVYACSARAWHLTMGAGESNRPSFWRTFAVTISANALNFLTPVVNAGGEPFRVAALAPWLGTRRAAGSVILHRMLHSFAYVLVWFTA